MTYTLFIYDFVNLCISKICVTFLRNINKNVKLFFYSRAHEKWKQFISHTNTRSKFSVKSGKKWTKENAETDGKIQKKKCCWLRRCWHRREKLHCFTCFFFFFQKIRLTERKEKRSMEHYSCSIEQANDIPNGEKLMKLRQIFN